MVKSNMSLNQMSMPPWDRTSNAMLCRPLLVGTVSWANTSSMADCLAVAPQPDLYSGTRVGDIPKPARGRICRLIIPFNCPKRLQSSPHLVPKNKGPSGSLEVVKRQAAHGIAAAARGAFVLENFGVDNLIILKLLLATPSNWSPSYHLPSQHLLTMYTSSL